jgi:hypothetical protein
VAAPIVWASVAGKPPARWIWNPRVDSLAILGVGSLLFAAIMIPGTMVIDPLSGWLVVAFAHVATVVNAPHYVATYDLIVEERHRNPANYRWFLISSALMLAVVVLVVGHMDELLGPLVRVYLTWSAYHYAAQHFGIGTMYAAKGGRPLIDREKRLLWLSFALTAALMILMPNLAEGDGVPSGLAGYANAFLPAWTYSVGLAMVGAGVVLAIVTERRVIRRTGSGLDSRVRLLWITNFAWFVLPNVWLPGAPTPLGGAQVALWVPLALAFFHCLQYLGVATNRLRTRRAVRPIYALFTAMMIGLLLFNGTAVALQATLGVPLMHAAVLMSAALNIHHFWLDGLVWRSPRRATQAAGVPAVA